MQSGRGGMGSHKHGISGIPTRSPRFKFQQQLEAREDERRKNKRYQTRFYESVAELMEKESK